MCLLQNFGIHRIGRNSWEPFLAPRNLPLFDEISANSLNLGRVHGHYPELAFARRLRINQPQLRILVIFKKNLNPKVDCP